MSAGLRLWLKIVLGTAVALTALFVLSPARPAVRAPAVVATMEGLGAGLLAYVIVARTRPLPPRRVTCLAVLTGKYALLAVLAANEEVVWRRVVLGELLRAGAVAAVAGSAAAFAVAHRTRPVLHLGTGATFGAVYAATGVLAASIAAHWTYNSLLASLGEREAIVVGATEAGAPR